jgi:hypothetical protein
MKQATKTCYISDDNYVACALCEDGRYAYLENDPEGMRLLKIVDTMAEAKELVLDYELAMKQFWEVFK